MSELTRERILGIVESPDEIKARERFGQALGWCFLIIWVALGLIGHFMKSPVPTGETARSALHYNSEEERRTSILDAHQSDSRPFKTMKRMRSE